MFDRRIRVWGYKVNHAKDKSNGDATGARTSNRKRKPKGSGDRQARSGMLGTPNETKFSDRDDLQTIPVIQSPDAYLLQEQMLSSVHNYALGVFQSRKWKFDPLRTYAPQGSQDFGAIWKDLSDQCFGAGILSRNHGQRREAIMKLQCILEGIEAVGNASDPHLLVRFWRLCRYLHGINLSTENEPSQPRGQILRLFITRFRDLARLNSGEQSPLYLLLDAFSKMDFEDAIWGLRIGHLRAIQTLQSIIGERHPMVLSMRVYYMKQWRIKDGRHHDMLVDHHLQTLRAAETTLGTSSDEAISILHDLTYYAYYSLQDDADMKTDKVLAFAIELRRRAGARLHGPCRWNMLTQYYTFATQILATMASAQNDLVQAESYIREAVARFHNGDVECQTRASMLLGKYERWIRDKNGPVWEVMRARETIQQLQSSLTNALSGKTRGH